MNFYPFIERKDGPLHYRTEVFPISEKGMVVMQHHKPIGYEGRIFIPYEDLPAVIEMMQAVYDKHAPKKEDSK